MNELKLYLRTKGNISEMLSSYEKLFNAEVLKTSLSREDNKTVTYAYMKIFNNVHIMIARYSPDRFPVFGYSQDIVISLKDGKEFDEAYEKIKNSPNFKIDYEPVAASWGTTIVKAYDKWGNGWILEKRTN